MSSETRHHRARVAALTRDGTPEQIQAARSDLAFAHAVEDVKGWPELSDDQRRELVRLLYAVAGQAAP